MRIGNTDFSEELLSEIREMTFREAVVKYPFIPKPVLKYIARPDENEVDEVVKPKKSKK